MCGSGCDVGVEKGVRATVRLGRSIDADAQNQNTQKKNTNTKSIHPPRPPRLPPAQDALLRLQRRVERGGLEGGDGGRLVVGRRPPLHVVGGGDHLLCMYMCGCGCVRYCWWVGRLDHRPSCWSAHARLPNTIKPTHRSAQQQPQVLLLLQLRVGPPPVGLVRRPGARVVAHDAGLLPPAAVGWMSHG